MKLRVFVLVFTLVAAFAPAHPISAQAAEQDDEARTLYSLGHTAFEQGRFQAAVDYFQQAYDLSHRPQLLYNIGQAADRLRLDARALAAFEAYLVALPDVENRRVVEARIEILRGAVAAARPAAPPVITPTEVAEADAVRAEATDAPAAATTSNGRSATGGWIVAGAGAGALVVGAIVLALGAKDYNAVTDAPMGSSWDSVADAHDRASTRITVGSVLLGVGAAAGATGLVLALSADGGADDDDDDGDAGAATGALELRVVPNGFLVRRTF